MGQGSSGSAEKRPTSLVPTSTQLRRADLQSKWWALQASGAASTPLCLQAYGKQFSSLAERHCGQHHTEHQRCIRSKKLDPLNMSSWYPACGEPYELESACAVGLLQEVDKRCRPQLDRAAAVLSASSDQADPKLKEPLEALGKCMSQLLATKGLAVQYDVAQAKSRFEASRLILAR
mmetsp:Transcript_8668/g.13765  ORF Transcript_8668/g.13765 Transcript_8668/m.13765 type:complete len:177 (-) Transcript_8668:68-598(-)